MIFDTTGEIFHWFVWQENETYQAIIFIRQLFRGSMQIVDLWMFKKIQ